MPLQLPADLEIRPYLTSYSCRGFADILRNPQSNNPSIVTVCLYVNGETLTGYNHDGQRISGVEHWRDMPQHIREIVRTHPSQELPNALNNALNRGGAIVQIGYEITVPPGWTREQFRTALVDVLPSNAVTSERLPLHRLNNTVFRSGVAEGGGTIGQGVIRIGVSNEALHGQLLNNARAFVADLHSPERFNTPQPNGQ